MTKRPERTDKRHSKTKRKPVVGARRHSAAVQPQREKPRANPFATFTEWLGDADEQAYRSL